MFAARLTGYEPAGNRLPGLLLDTVSWDASFPLNDVAALTVKYPSVLDAAGLMTGPVEVAVEVSDGGAWVEPRNARFLSSELSANLTEALDVPSFTLRGLGALLERAFVLRPDENPGKPYTTDEDDPKRNFLSATPGQIIEAVIGEARTKYSDMLQGVTLGFTAGEDSLGNGWDKLDSVAYSPDTDLLRILDDMTARGVCDWWMQGRTLHAVNADSAARTLDLRLLLTDATEAPLRVTYEALATHVEVAGGDGKRWQQPVEGANVPYGDKVTRIANESVTTDGTALDLINRQKALAVAPRREYTRAVADTHRQPPFFAWTVGDWVQAENSVGDYELVRIFEAGLSFDASQPTVTARVTLNDRFVDASVRDAKRLKGITHGATQVLGDGGVPSRVDKAVPAAPQGVTANSLGYWLDATPLSSVDVSWQAVTTSGDGLPLNGIDYYDVSCGGQSKRATGTSVGFDGLQPSRIYEVRVRAVSSTGIAGPWSTRTEVLTAYPPDQLDPPTAPTFRTESGAFQAIWDGLLQGSGLPHDPPLHFSHILIEVRPEATLAWTRYSRDSGFVQTGLAADTKYFARFVAVDALGNESAPGPQGMVTVVSNYEIMQAEADRLAQEAEDAQLAAMDALNEAFLAQGGVEGALQAIAGLEGRLTPELEAARDAALSASQDAAASIQAAQKAQDETIVSTTTEFCLGTATTPGNVWEPTAPTRGEGQTLWQRTIVTRGDGKTTTLPAFPVTGDPGSQGPPGGQGPKGEDGAGIEIAGTVPTYADLPKNLGAGDVGKAYLNGANGLLYIWDGTSFPTENKGVEFRGPEGADGVGIQSLTPFYALMLPMVEARAVLENGVVFADTGLSVVRPTNLQTVGGDVYWDDDLPGDDTKLVVDTQTGDIYAVDVTEKTSWPDPPSPPTTATPSTPWSSTEPAFRSDSRLYRTERILYSDGSFQYTPVTEVAAWQGAAQAAGLAANLRDYVEAGLMRSAKASKAPAPFKGGMWAVLDEESGKNMVGLKLANVAGNAWVSHKLVTEDLMVVSTSGAITLKNNTVTAANIVASEALSAKVAQFIEIETGQITWNNAVGNNAFIDTLTGKTAFWDRLHVKGAITVGGPNQVGTTLIADNAITTAKIYTGAVDATKIKTGALDAFQITSPLIQSVSAANRGIKWNGNSFVAYNNSGTEMLRLDGNTGLIKGVNIEGVTITGGLIRTATSGRRVEINSDGLKSYAALPNTYAFLDKGSLQFYSASTRRLEISADGTIKFWDANEQLRTQISTYGTLTVSSPDLTKPSGSTQQLIVDSWRIQGTKTDPNGNVTQTSNFNFGNGVVNWAQLDGIVKFIVKGDLEVDGYTRTWARTTTASANVVRSSPLEIPGVLYQTTSLRRAKVGIAGVPATLADRILSVPVRDWIDRGAQEREKQARVVLANPESSEADRENAEMTLREGLRRIPGVIAEEVMDAGLAEFCTFDENGALNGVMYDRLPLLLIPLVKQLRGEVVDLRTRIDQLEGAD